jgi:hypothetical protein
MAERGLPNLSTEEMIERIEALPAHVCVDALRQLLLDPGESRIYEMLADRGILKQALERVGLSAN